MTPFKRPITEQKQSIREFSRGVIVRRVFTGKVGIVGERGPEAIMGPHTVIPNNALGGAVNLKVNIINQAGVDVQQRQSPDGSGLDVLITNKVNDILGSGKADKTMRGRYGTSPQMARR